MDTLVEKTIGGLHEMLLRRLPQISYDSQVLDIGCGTGAWLERLASHGFKHLQGVDLEGEQFMSRRATFIQADLNTSDLGLGGRRFGLITAIEVVEHLENPGRLFQAVEKLLDDTGYFILTTPNIHSIHSRLRFLLTNRMPAFDEKSDPTHVYPVLLSSLERILLRYSLSIEQRWGYPERGSLIFSKPVQLMSSILSRILPNVVPGDTLCIVIRKKLF